MTYVCLFIVGEETKDVIRAIGFGNKYVVRKCIRVPFKEDDTESGSHLVEGSVGIYYIVGCVGAGNMGVSE